MLNRKLALVGKELRGHQKSTRKTVGIVLPILSVGDASPGSARIHFEVAFEAEAQRAFLSMKDKVAEFVSHGESALPRLSQPFRPRPEVALAAE